MNIAEYLMFEALNACAHAQKNATKQKTKRKRKYHHITEGKYPISLISPNRLHEHEECNLEHVYDLVIKIKKDEMIKKPIVVESHYFIVMDGHHRLQAAKTLNLKWIPTVLLSYTDSSIYLKSWREGQNITPSLIIECAKCGRLLPVKTTCHKFSPDIGYIHMPLHKLQ